MPSRTTRRSRCWAALAAAALAWMPAISGADEPSPVVNTVKLDVEISGLAARGCKVEIKPANPGCKFEPIVKKFDKVPASGVLRIDPVAIKASTLNADRDCAFSIIVTEADGKPVTYKRSIRLLEAPADGSTPEVAQSFLIRNAVVASKGGSERRP